MTLRKTSNEATFETDPWSPVAETFVQFEGDAVATTEVIVYGRVDDSAVWVEIFRFQPTTADKIRRLAKVPRMKVGVFGNTPGNAVSIRTGE